MPATVENYEEPNHQGRKPKYAWDDWYLQILTAYQLEQDDGNYRAVQFAQGKDFDCSLQNMQNRMYRKWAGKERKVQIQLREESHSLFCRIREEDNGYREEEAEQAGKEEKTE